MYKQLRQDTFKTDSKLPFCKIVYNFVDPKTGAHTQTIEATGSWQNTATKFSVAHTVVRLIHTCVSFYGDGDITVKTCSSKFLMILSNSGL